MIFPDIVSLDKKRQYFSIPFSGYLLVTWQGGRVWQGGLHGRGGVRGGGGVRGFIQLEGGMRGFIRGGHAWFYSGGVRGFIWGGGACVHHEQQSHCHKYLYIILHDIS